MRLYLGGPMSGFPLWNFPAFDAAAESLRARGYGVVSPAELDRAIGFDEHTGVLPDGFLIGALRRDIEALLAVDGVVLLPGWRRSKGCAIETTVATALGLPLFEYSLHALEPVSGDETILLEAQGLVYGDRNAAYGHPADDFARTGRMWGAILGTPDVPPERVGLCMAAVKISREVNAHKRDNLVDLAGYAATVDMVHQRLTT